MQLIKKPEGLNRNDMILDILEINARTGMYDQKNLKHMLARHDEAWLSAVYTLENHIEAQQRQRVI